MGKELLRGTNMVHESSPLSEPLMAAGNFTEVINDGSVLGNHKAQFPLDVKIRQNPLPEGSVKSEANGIAEMDYIERSCRRRLAEDTDDDCAKTYPMMTV